MHNKNSEILLHLSLIDNIGPATIFKVLHKLLLDQNQTLLNPDWVDVFKKSACLNLSVIYDYSVSDFINIFGLSENCAQRIYTGLADSEVLEQELILAEKNDIKIVDILSLDYVPLLRQIHVPPVVLYFSGALIDQQVKHLGIVGSRGADDYALHVIENIVPVLVSNGWVIVSGGANGADTMAHKATLNSNGKTVVVLGSGILCPYPENNIDLFYDISNRGGTIVSPFPLKRSPDKGTFPARNRIISGLSLGCLVVQAAAKSGALITANCALEQGRQVFAVPGRIDDKLSAGCNELIKQGAKVVCNSNDILEEFGENLPAGIFRPAVTVHRQVSIDAKPNDQCEDVVLCKLDKSATIDELIIKTGLDFNQLQDKLFGLQLEGKVKQNFTGAWEKI